MIRTGQGVGTTHAKALLMGEHAVVYGFPAVVVPLSDLKVRAYARLRNDNNWLTCSFYAGPLGDAPQEVSGLQLLISAAMEELSWDGSVEISIQSDIPPGYGLGSSAAVAAAVARALYDLVRRTPSREKLLELVGVSETIYHGVPSGVDAMAAISDKPLWFVRGHPPMPISIGAPMFLVLAATSQPANTRQMVQRVRGIQERFGLGAGPIHRIGALTRASRTALEHGDYPYVGALMTEVHRELVALNTTTPAMDRLITVALGHGALGAKLTGSGGGGSIVVLVQDAEKQRQVAEGLKLAGASAVWTPTFGAIGRTN